MELRVLRYFLTVVREENISKAAELLHVTQPTLSRQLMQLEEELGTQLFIRGRHLTLTDSGIMLRRRAEEVVNLLDKIESEFDEQNELSGIISIGSGGLSASKVLLDVLEEFRKKYPKIHYEFYTDNATNIKEKLDKGLLDFGLLLEPVNIEKYDYIRMKEKEQWGILMPIGSPLIKKEYIKKEDLIGLPLITTNRITLQKELSNWFGDDFLKLNIFATYNVITNVTMLVNNGTAHALTIKGAVEFLDKKEFIFKPLYPELFMTSVLAWKKFQPFFGAAGKFLEFFKANYSTK